MSCHLRQSVEQPRFKTRTNFLCIWIDISIPIYDDGVLQNDFLLSSNFFIILIDSNDLIFIITP